MDGRRRATANGLAGALEGLGEAGVAIGGRVRVGEECLGSEAAGEGVDGIVGVQAQDWR